MYCRIRQKNRWAYRETSQRQTARYCIAIAPSSTARCSSANLLSKNRVEKVLRHLLSFALILPRSVLLSWQGFDSVYAVKMQQEANEDIDWWAWKQKRQRKVFRKNVHQFIWPRSIYRKKDNVRDRLMNATTAVAFLLRCTGGGDPVPEDWQCLERSSQASWDWP